MTEVMVAVSGFEFDAAGAARRDYLDLTPLGCLGAIGGAQTGCGR
jgi:hypothetical protein